MNELAEKKYHDAAKESYSEYLARLQYGTAWSRAQTKETKGERK